MTDESNTGLVFVLQQKNGDISHTIQTGSRFSGDAESRYVTIEKEILVSRGRLKSVTNLWMDYHILKSTNHKPLVATLNNQRLNEIKNPRLQLMKTKLMSYHFTARLQKGILNHASDALSRNPINDPEEDGEVAEDQSQSSYKLAAISQRADLHFNSLKYMRQALVIYFDIFLNNTQLNT